MRCSARVPLLFYHVGVLYKECVCISVLIIDLFD